MDGDADLDLFVVSDGDASHVLRNDGALAFTDVTPAAVAVPGADAGAACADIDLDGDLDVYVTRYGEKNQMFRNDGAGGFEDVAGLMLADSLFSTGAAFGDADRDGDPDLFMADDGDANRLFRNDQANGNHWLQVCLHGTHSNRSAIGARVRVVAGGVSQVRELSGGSGFGSQDELLAAFGLGASTSVDSIIVSWPSGVTAVVSPVAVVDQRLDLTETSAPLAVGNPPASGPGVKLAAPSPNPFRSGTRLAYELSRAAQVRLRVHDAQGRQVATLADGLEGPGVHGVSWDGRDDAGHDAPAGLYLVRLSTADGARNGTQVVKLLLAR
ncbi:MAG: FG-GAP-like repeat-containing protein [Candidatus Eisenbacteria bacterium]